MKHERVNSLLIHTYCFFIPTENLSQDMFRLLSPEVTFSAFLNILCNSINFGQIWCGTRL